MVIGFFLFETFKKDVLSEVISIKSYTSSIRRKLVDLSAKIIKQAMKLY